MENVTTIDNIDHISLPNHQIQIYCDLLYLMWLKKSSVNIIYLELKSEPFTGFQFCIRNVLVNLPD